MHEHTNQFRQYAETLAHIYWYLIAAVVGFLMLLRAFEWYEKLSRSRLLLTRSTTYPTQPQNVVTKAYAVTTAVARELTYPQIYISGKFSWLSPPSAGRTIIIFVYWAVVTFMMVDKAIIKDVEYYERIAFRAAWISITQVPLVYLLATKSSIVGCLIGTSHEKLNWLHRWVSRTLLVTATVHGGFFMREWMLADFVLIELQIMPMVKYGIGAWAILAWNFLTSLSPLRSAAYEVFVLQHIASAAVLLWVLWVHIPPYSHYYLWFSIACISFDWFLRGLLFVYRNIYGRVSASGIKGLKRIGYTALLKAEENDITVITLRNISLSWHPGQYLYLWTPSLGPLETHPFTIAASNTEADGTGNIQFVVRAQAGFSRRIHRYAQREEQQTRTALVKAFISGPYGTPLNSSTYESVILIAGSTGASFTLPILERLMKSAETTCVQRIHFILVARQRNGMRFYEERLQAILGISRSFGVQLYIQIAITGDFLDPDGTQPILAGDSTEVDPVQVPEGLETQEPKESAADTYSHIRQSSHSPSSSTSSQQEGDHEDIQRVSYTPLELHDAEEEIPESLIIFSVGRPDLAVFIRDTVEVTGGETSVVVCGGKSLVSNVRNTVTRLSDDRAVHKGTGAQGIHLHVEEFCY